MDMKELSKTAPAMPAEKADDLKRLATHDLNFLIHSVGYVEKLLLLVWRERNVECGPFLAESLPFYISFLHICTVGLKHLNAVIPAIPHIHQTIVGDGNRVRRVELSRTRPFKRTGVGSFVVRQLAVGSPVALVSASVRIKDDHSPVPVAISHKYFIGFGIHGDRCRTVEVLRIITAARLSVMPDL